MSSSERPPYTESVIIMTTVRGVALYTLTLGLFIMFHGASTPGGGFQGGVVFASAIIMLALGFGVEVIRDWVWSSVVVFFTSIGLGLFMGLGIGSIVFGGSFLEYSLLPLHEASKYSIELVELGIGVTVAGVLVTLFFLLSGGYRGRENCEGRDKEC